jgi:hypothetical protein
METPKQTIAYFDKTQRIRLAFTLPVKDSSCQDVWVKYTETRHSPTDQSRPRATLYSGPEGKKLPDGIKKVDTNTLVKELGTESVSDWRIPAYPLWKARYGEAQPSDYKMREIAKKVEFINGKRKRGDDNDTTPRKRASSDKDPLQLADGADDSLSVYITALLMSEDEVLEAFNEYDEPISDAVLYRIGGIVKEVEGVKVAPPLVLLRKIRDNGNCINPWHSRAWREWLQSVKFSDELEEVEPEKFESSEREKVESPKREQEQGIDTETVSAPNAPLSPHSRACEAIRLLDKLCAGRPFRGYDWFFTLCCFCFRRPYGQRFPVQRQAG